MFEKKKDANINIKMLREIENAEKHSEKKEVPIIIISTAESTRKRRRRKE